MGYLLYHSDIMIANLDETLDPGVLIEIMVAKEMNKPVIGYRSDMRVPYGYEGIYTGGMHMFAMLPCDSMVFVP
jgi:nucleoside 2-deoxyribosyltransferase